MKSLIRKIKACFGIYEENYLYKVKIKDIIISTEFQLHKPKLRKVLYKRDFYEKYGYFESPIILTKDYKLVDGYISYLILKENNVKYVKVLFQKNI